MQAPCRHLRLCIAVLLCSQVLGEPVLSQGTANEAAHLPNSGYLGGSDPGRTISCWVSSVLLYLLRASVRLTLLYWCSAASLSLAGPPSCQRLLFSERSLTFFLSCCGFVGLIPWSMTTIQHCGQCEGPRGLTVSVHHLYSGQQPAVCSVGAGTVIRHACKYCHPGHRASPGTPVASA